MAATMTRRQADDGPGARFCSQCWELHGLKRNAGPAFDLYLGTHTSGDSFLLVANAETGGLETMVKMMACVPNNRLSQLLELSPSDGPHGFSFKRLEHAHGGAGTMMKLKHAWAAKLGLEQPKP
jgi:hypothetical protein